MSLHSQPAAVDSLSALAMRCDMWVRMYASVFRCRWAVLLCVVDGRNVKQQIETLSPERGNYDVTVRHPTPHIYKPLLPRLARYHNHFIHDRHK